MTQQFDVLAGQKGAGELVMVNNDSSSLVRFSNYSEDFKQTNCGVPLGIDRLTMLKWKSRHMVSFAEETGDHLLQLLARLRRPTRRTVVLFRAHTHRSTFR